MTRGLHPHTRPQRAKGDVGWSTPPAGVTVELQEPPPRRVGQVLVAILVVLLVCMAGVGLLLHVIATRAPLPPAKAAARFETAGPPLLSDPDRERAVIEDLHAPPSGEDKAIEAVLRRGWGEAEPAPDRAATALERAEARR